MINEETDREAAERIVYTEIGRMSPVPVSTAVSACELGISHGRSIPNKEMLKSLVGFARNYELTGMSVSYDQIVEEFLSEQQGIKTEEK